MKFEKDQKVVIVDGMIKAKVISYYYGETTSERVKVVTENGHEWCIKTEDLARVFGKTEK